MSRRSLGRVTAAVPVGVGSWAGAGAGRLAVELVAGRLAVELVAGMDSPA